MSASTELEQGRTAYARRAWLEAYEAFSQADEEGALETEDLELFAWTTLTLGHDDESIGILERAHHRYSSWGRGTARCALRRGSA